LRQHHGHADGLHGTSGEQEAECRRRGAGCRADGEHRNPAEKGHPLADPLTERAAGQQERPVAERVKRGDPLQPGRGSVKGHADVRQHHVDQGRVERGQHQPQAQRGQHRRRARRLATVASWPLAFP
jgi:hypothetical protein